MEEFEFPCPKCGEPLISDEETGGTEAVCPYCDKLIILPKTPPAPAAPVLPVRPVPDDSHLPVRRQSGHPLPPEKDIAPPTPSTKSAEPTHLPSGRKREARENLDRLSAMARGRQIDPITSTPTKGKVSFHCPGCARLIWVRPKDAGMVVNCAGCTQDVVCPSPGKDPRLLHAADSPEPGKSQKSKTELPSKRSADHLPVEAISPNRGDGSARTLLPSAPNRPGRTLDGSAKPDPLPSANVKPIPKQRDIEISPSELKRYRAASRERKIQRATAPHEEFKTPPGNEGSSREGTQLPPSRDKLPGDAGSASTSTAAGGHRLNPERVPKFAVREDLDQSSGEPVDTWGSDVSHPARGTRRLLIFALVLGLPALAAAAYFGFRGQKDARTVPVSEASADNSIGEYEAAEALLKRFLAAKTIDEKLPLVRHPEATRPRMEVHEGQGHLPLPQVADLHWPQSGHISGKKFSWIRVKFNDDTVRTAVFEMTAEGPKLDWESFVLFADPLMSDFVSRQPTEPSVYRVVCTLDDYYNRLYKDEYKYLCLKLVGADEVSTCWAYTESNSEISRKLAQLFAANRRPLESDDEARSDGIKIMLKIHFVKDEETGESNSQAWIDAIVSDSWMIP